MMAGQKKLICSLPHVEQLTLMACVFQASSVSAIRSAMVSYPMVFELHIGVSERAMLGDTPSHSHAPHAKGAGFELLPHESDDVRLRQTYTRLDGLKGRSVFPRHLNHGRDVTRRKTGYIQNAMPN
jgi:hypothetical protein